jgi:hypothetical protein
MDTESNNKTQDRRTPQGKAKHVDKSRRAFTRAGMAAPVFLTLASRPVLGAQCLSQMMSGNVSQIGDGSCEPGFGVETWSNPNATLLGSDVVARKVGIGRGLFQWNEDKGFSLARVFGTEQGREVFQWAGSRGFIFGKFKVKPDQLAPDKPDDYTGGTKFNEVFPAFGSFDENYGLTRRSITMREILHEEPASIKAHFVAAMLNAQYVPNYVLTARQVLELWSGMSPMAVTITNINEFLESTWRWRFG